MQCTVAPHGLTSRGVVCVCSHELDMCFFYIVVRCAGVDERRWQCFFIQFVSFSLSFLTFGGISCMTGPSCQKRDARSPCFPGCFYFSVLPLLLFLPLGCNTCIMTYSVRLRTFSPVPLLASSFFRTCALFLLEPTFSTRLASISTYLRHSLLCACVFFWAFSLIFNA